MPDKTLPTPPASGLTITLTVQHLERAHATVWAPATLRRLFNDGLAQLDAIEAGSGT